MAISGRYCEHDLIIATEEEDGPALEGWSAIIGWAGSKIAGAANVKGFGKGECSTMCALIY
jgi:hypothetical protein